MVDDDDIAIAFAPRSALICKIKSRLINSLGAFQDNAELSCALDTKRLAGGDGTGAWLACEAAPPWAPPQGGEAPFISLS
jgi:hypothetical protein